MFILVGQFLSNIKKFLSRHTPQTRILTFLLISFLKILLSLPFKFQFFLPHFFTNSFFKLENSLIFPSSFFLRFFTHVLSKSIERSSSFLSRLGFYSLLSRFSLSLPLFPITKRRVALRAFPLFLSSFLLFMLC